ncbi:MAG: hypothetical protein P1V20_02315 [Verrucomicrobiales bacterium]|nr:hypothetical protein [Verrucomicrobiales bacterium]
MKILPSLCIDLGAAFTKIAIRANQNDTSILLGDPGQSGDYQICIPSLALQRVSTNSWLFGWELLDLDPAIYLESDDIRIFQNWKSNLFPAPGSGISVEEHQQAITCCREFIRALGGELIPMMLTLHPQFQNLKLADFEAHICVPEFVLDSGQAKIIDEIMAHAGFRKHGSYCISEPKSSLIGILTEGQNYLNNDGTPNVNYMFREFDLLEKLTSNEESVLFLDIGAFTTDFALTSLDGKHRAKVNEAAAASYPYGIFELDRKVILALGDDFMKLIDESEASFRENFHRFAYNCAEDDEIILRDGTELDNSAIGKCIDHFANSIITSCEEFLKKYQSGNIEIAVLTGGGTICSRISSRIASALDRFDILVVRAHENANVSSLDPISSELVRGSSAIGGTSVLYSLK